MFSSFFNYSYGHLFSNNGLYYVIPGCRIIRLFINIRPIDATEITLLRVFVREESSAFDSGRCLHMPDDGIRCEQQGLRVI